MPPAARILQTPEPVAEPPEPVAVDSDVVVILAALLCALICVVGLALVARCAWLRRSSSEGGGGGAPPPPPNKGLKKKALRSLPKLSYDGAVAVAGGRLADCPICLAEFVEGDEIRILPPCGHGFHVGCVDTWLGSHSSCPSCRRILVVSAASSSCRRCGVSSAVSSAATSAATEGGAKAREDGDANRFLP